MPISEKKVKKMCENKEYEQKDFVVTTLTFLANKISKLSLKRISEEEIVTDIINNTDKITFQHDKKEFSSQQNQYEIIVENDKQKLIEELLGKVSYPGIVSENGNTILNEAFKKYIACIVLYGANLEKFNMDRNYTKPIAIVNLLFNKLGNHRTLINYIKTPSIIKKDLQKIEYEDTTLWQYIDDKFSKVTNRNDHAYFDIYNAISDSRVNDMPNSEEDIYTGIRAIDNSINPRIHTIIDIMNDTIDYMEQNTELTKPEVRKKINENIHNIDIVKPCEAYTETGEMPPSKYNSTTGMLVINIDFLEKEREEELKESIRKETLFFMGLDSKVFSARKQVEYIGYCRGVQLGKMKKIFKIKDNSFNKAVAAMFLNESKELKQKKFLIYYIVTDQTEGDYDTYINTNLVKQIIVALGIKNKQLYEGLYDIKAAQEMRNLISGYKPKTFDKISKGIDEISHFVKSYRKIRIEEKKKKLHDDKKIYYTKKKSKIIEELDKKLKKVEKTIVQDILLPRIEKLREEEKQEVLNEYYKNIISCKSFFTDKTGFAKNSIKKHNVFSNQIEVIEQPNINEQEINEERNYFNSKNEEKEVNYYDEI